MQPVVPNVVPHVPAQPLDEQAEVRIEIADAGPVHRGSLESESPSESESIDDLELSQVPVPQQGPHAPQSANAQQPVRRRRRRGLRGVGKRLKNKAVRGRGVGDLSNAVGSISNLISPDENGNPMPVASALVAIGGLGVLANGLSMTIAGAREFRQADTDHKLRQSSFAMFAGLQNVVSGASGLAAGILQLSGSYTAGSLAGTASTTAWALSEVSNIFAQIDVIAHKASSRPRGFANVRRHWKAYAKASLAAFASLVKGVGAVLSLYVTVMKALEKDVDNESNAAAYIMLIGSAISVLHAIIKLGIVCGVEFTSFEDAPAPDPDSQV